MRILLQHLQTGLYFADPGAWTKDVNDAMDFGNLQRATEYARARKMSDVQVIAVFTGHGCIEIVSFPIQSPARTRAGASARARL